MESTPSVTYKDIEGSLYRGPALSALRTLKARMKLGGLLQATCETVIAKGVVAKCSSIFGIDEVEIITGIKQQALIIVTYDNWDSAADDPWSGYYACSNHTTDLSIGAIGGIQAYSTSGAVIKYESSNTAIATIDQEGNILIVGRPAVGEAQELYFILSCDPTPDYYGCRVEGTKHLIVQGKANYTVALYINDSPIIYGVALDGFTVVTPDVPGTIVIDPAFGTYLTPSVTQYSITAEHTATDTDAYNTPVGDEKLLLVNKDTPVIGGSLEASYVYGTPWEAIIPRLWFNSHHVLDSAWVVSGSYSVVVSDHSNSSFNGTITDTTLKPGADSGIFLVYTFTVANTALYENPAPTGAYDNGFAITKKALTVTANSVTRTYNGVAWSGGNGVTYSGFIAGENESVLGGVLSYSGTAQGSINEGTYTGGIVPGGLTSDNYEITFVAGNLTTTQAVPDITFNLPTYIVAGDNLTGYDATSSIAGISFTYHVDAPTGTQIQLSDAQAFNTGLVIYAVSVATENYASGNVWDGVVVKGVPVITWPDPLGITYGTALSAVQLNATASVAGTFVYSPDSGTVPNANNGLVLSVTFTPTDTTHYTTATAVADIAVAKATPVITWNDPAAITYGTALSSTQLNATANTEGTFVYTPAAGTVPDANRGLALTVEFTPTDTANWNGASDFSGIAVDKATQTISAFTYSSYGYNTYLVVGEWFFDNGDLTVSSGLPATLTVQTPTIGYLATQVGFEGAFIGTKNGTAVIRATQAGNSNYLPATPVDCTLSVTALPGSGSVQATVYCSVPATSILVGQTMQASASGGSGTGAYVFAAVNSSAISVSSSGLITALAPGTSTVVAYRSGDSNYNASAYSAESATITVSVASVAALSYTVLGGNTVRIDGGYPYTGGTFSVAIVYANGSTTWDGSADNVYVSSTGASRVYSVAAMLGSQYWCAKAGVGVRFTDSSGASILVHFQSGFTPPAPEFVPWVGSYGYNVGGYFYGTDIADVTISGIEYRCYYVSADIFYDSCYTMIGTVDIDPGGPWCCYRIDVGRCMA